MKLRWLAVWLMLVGFVCSAQAQVISINSVTNLEHCAGGDLEVEFEIDHDFNLGNEFTVVLSDEDGEFTNSTDLTPSLAAETQGVYTMTVNIPETAETSIQYRLKVKASDPDEISDQSSPFTIYSLEAHAGNEQEFCNGNTAILGANNVATGGSGNYTYSWTAEPTDASLDGQDTEANPEVTPEETTVYTLTVTDGNTNCTAVSEVTITVNPLPTPEVDGESSLCINTESSFSPMEDNETSTYSWTLTKGEDELATATTSTFTYLFDATGVYTLALEETTELGCVESTTHDITITELPVIAFEQAPETLEICVGGNLELVPTVTGGTGDFTYSWNDDSSLDDTSIENPTATPEVTTTYTLTVTDENGCVASNTITVIVHPLPAPEITGAGEICVKTTQVYKAVTIESSEFSWSVENGVIDEELTAADSLVVTFNTPGVGTVSLTETTINGCESTEVMNITINGHLPVITGNATACLNETHNYSVTNHDGSTYEWTVVGGTIESGEGTNEITVTWDESTLETAGTINLVETSNDCSQEANFEVNGLAFPTPVITGTVEICNEKEATYTCPLTEENSYEWTVVGGTITAGEATNEITVMWDKAGDNTVEVTETNADNCEAKFELAVTVFELPVPTITGTEVLCDFSQEYEYTTESTGTLLWTVEGGTITTAADIATIKVEWTSEGGVLTLKEVNENNCETTTTFDVEVIDQPRPEITGLEELCEFTENVKYSTPDVKGSSYLWDITGGEIVSDNDKNEITVNWHAAGNASLSLIETSENGANCETATNFDVVLNALPKPVISGDDYVCRNENGQYQVNTTANSTYKWTVIGGEIIEGQDTDAITVKWGNHSAGTVMVEETNAKACVENTEFAVNLYTLPTPNLEGQTHVCEFVENVNYETELVAKNTYRWEVDGGEIVGSNTNASIKVNWGEYVDINYGRGVVRVYETNENGCEIVDSTNIWISPNPFAEIEGKREVCTYEEATVYSTVAKDGLSYEWTVEGGEIVNGQNTNSIEVNWLDKGYNYITVKATAEGGCFTIDEFKVRVKEVVPATILGRLVAQKESENNMYRSPNNGKKYVWTIENGTIVSQDDTKEIMVTWADAAEGKLTLIESNSDGSCESVSEITVTLSDLPVLTLTGDENVCAGSTAIEYSVPNNTGSTFEWAVTGGTITAGQGTNTITVDWDAAGAAAIEVTETLKNGDKAIGSNSINIVALPEPNITGETTVCSGKEITYTSDEANVDAEWAVVGGSIIGANNEQTVVVVWDENAAETELTLINRTSDLGCEASSNATITVNASPVKPTVTKNFDTDKWQQYLESSSAFGNQWYKNGVKMDGETSQILWITETADYTVVVTNDQNCESEVSEVNSIDTDVEESAEELNTLTVYPNPASEYVNVNYASEDAGTLKIRITNIIGEVVYSETLSGFTGSFQRKVDIANYSAGIYVINFEFAGSTSQVKFVVTH